MTVLRATTLLGLVSCLLVALLAVPARAHGGEVVYSGPVGPYDVIVTDSILDTGEGLVYTLTVRDRSTELPVDGADVLISARFDGDTFGPRSAQYFANQYQVLIPDDRADTVEVTATINGPSGTATLRHEVAGSGGGGNSRLVSVLLVGVGALAIALDLQRRRGRASDGPRSADPGAGDAA